MSSVSPVVGHADVNAQLVNGPLREFFCSPRTRQSSSAPCQLRLTWKRPAQAPAATAVSTMRMQPSFFRLNSLDRHPLKVYELLAHRSNLQGVCTCPAQVNTRVIHSHRAVRCAAEILFKLCCCSYYCVLVASCSGMQRIVVCHGRSRVCATPLHVVDVKPHPMLAYFPFDCLIRRRERQPAAGPTDTLVDISPQDFVSLTLPVYKAMFEHMPKSTMLRSLQMMRGRSNTNEALRWFTIPHYYTSVSFGRLLSLARRQLRLRVAHFEAALDAIMDNSGLMLAPNLQQEQVILRSI